jgi:hypothetical protein
MLQNITQGLELGLLGMTWATENDMRFGTWDISNLFKSG